MSPLDLARQLLAHFPHDLDEPQEFRGEVTLRVRDPERIADICRYARDELPCQMLLDLTGVDEFDRSPRWTLVYELYSLTHHAHLRLKTGVEEAVSELPSVTSVWRTADWHEREVYDMFGLRFRGHPDLRRILMWEGYPYHPLRKDFPLEGKPSAIAEVAFTERAPLEGGPFVTRPGARRAPEREPRAHPADESDA
ncbi:MAG: NADH-quinone oxidoreductase subunit C [Verrucomicrobia bacterium]|nr:MAG: NADH-quinone oxidoreductase subunit C [Verrucomicrobiota bacterium]